MAFENSSPIFKAFEQLRSKLRDSPISSNKKEIRDALLDFQGGCCAICDKPIEGKSANLDHHHEQCYMRGVLCRSCNLAVGLLKDKVINASRMAIYLSFYEELHKQGWA